MSAKLQAGDFVHLHNHTHHSLLDGLQKIGPMLDRAKELGMHQLAITDHGTLSGAVEFYKAARDREMKPIIGIETYVANRLHTDKDPQKDKGRFHLLLFAMNNQGYENLMRLSTLANLDGYYYKPRIDRELIEKYNEGLIATSACIGGEVGEALRNDNYELARKNAEWYKGVFGDRYYLEVQDHGHQWDEQRKVNQKVIELGADLDIPCVVTADAHYTVKEDQQAHEVLLCVQTGALLDEPGRFSLKDTDLYLKDPIDIIERWSDYPEVISNTKKLADRCEIEIQLGNILIPKFNVPKGKTEKSYLEELIYHGLVERYVEKPPKDLSQLNPEQCMKLLDSSIVDRTKYELGVINQMGFSGYFLIVADFINWGKARGIVFGPGRGSAAGSIISYALKITELDPLRYDLLFERFLNPDRISMPDIDIDIQDSRRDEVIQYCVEKYGEDQVAAIVTFGTMAARNAIRDVSRVLDVPYAEADRLAKLVPPPIQGRHIPLAVSIEEDDTLKQEYDTNSTSRKVIDLAIKLEGTIRSHGVHAAGVVIAPDELVKYTPLEMSQKGVVATQYAMGPVEELGLLKMDFLGLSNLTIINNAQRIVRKVYGEEILLEDIPLDDLETYQLLGRGETTGIFQFESAGMKRYLRQLQPTVFDDLIAMGALYRPGPMQFIDDFIERKHGRREIEYLHPRLEESLKSTYGVLVYQEQVMEIAKDLCGFSGGQADTLRKAIGKKIAALLAKMKAEFIEGGVKHSGVDPATMEIFWKQLEDFAAYCFNKSHAACYGMISYWTAYLKAHYPAAFMAALMTSDFDDTDRLYIEISECKSMGIDVLPPDVNQSFVEFAVVQPEKKSQKIANIRYGLAAIKNVGTGAVEEILRARKLDGEFKSVEEFAKRVSTRIVNRKAWESLIKTGAFDSLESDRGKLLMNLETLLGYGAKYQKEQNSGQTDLFGGDVPNEIAAKIDWIQPHEAISEKETLQWEKELLGIYLSAHPLDSYETYLNENTVPISKLAKTMDGKKAVIGGVVIDVREIVTKKGSKMAFVKFADVNGETELVVFPEPYAANLEHWQADKILEIEGSINARDREGRIVDEVKILAKKSIELTPELLKKYKSTGKKKAAPKPKKELEEPVSNPISQDLPIPVAAKPQQKLYIQVSDPDNDDQLKRLKTIIDQHPGDTEVILVIDRRQRQAIRLPMRIDPNEELVEGLTKVFGTQKVVLK